MTKDFLCLKRILITLALGYFSIISLAQDYVINLKGEKIPGKIMDCSLKKVKLKLAGKKNLNFNAHEINAYFDSAHNLYCFSKLVINTDERIFLPIKDTVEKAFYYTNPDDFVKIFRADSITLYLISQKREGTTFGRYGSSTQTYYNIYWYLESPSLGVSRVYEPNMNPVYYQTSIYAFQSYFSGKPALIKKINDAVNDEKRQREIISYEFLLKTMLEYFQRTTF